MLQRSRLPQWRVRDEPPDVGYAGDEEAFQARFLEEDERYYVVYDLHEDEEVRIPKARAVAEVYPPTRRNPLRGAGLFRWSVIALIAALIGGLGGMILGALVALLAAARLVGFTQRVTRWRKRQEGGRWLPAQASAERLRLLAAFWQGVLALALGAFVFALLTGRLF